MNSFLASIHKHQILLIYADLESNDYMVKNALMLENGVPYPVPKDNYCFLRCLSCNCDLYPNKDNSKSFNLNEEWDNSEDTVSIIPESLNLNNEEFYKIEFENENKNQPNIILIGEEDEKKNLPENFHETINKLAKICKNFLLTDISDQITQQIMKEKNVLQNKNNSLKNKEKKLLKENESLKQKNEEIQKKIEDLSNSKAKCDEEKNSLENSNKELKEENNKLKDEKFKLEKDNDSLKIDKENLNAKLLKLNIINNERDNDKDRDYDIIVGINSFFELDSTGWLIKYPKGKEEYEKKSKMDTIIVGVIGNRNKGKSFILQKLSGHNIPKGFFVVTEGLSIKYGEKEDHCVAILDSAGKEGPLLNPDIEMFKDIDENMNKNNSNENETSENKRNIYEKCLRDKLITETYIQGFIIDNSHILILVVGDINLNEQKLLQNVKNTIKPNQHLYVIHNLIDSHTHEQVEDYIQNKLKKLFGIELEERTFQNNDKDKYHQKFYVEKQNQKIVHFILVNEYCDISQYYNTPTIDLLKNKISGELGRVKFSVLDKCKEYFKQIGEKFIEEKIDEKNFDDESSDKIILKEKQKITLKKVFIDEIGQTLTNNFGQPYYSYYTEGKDLIINIEAPGENADIKTKCQKFEGFYIFYFKGTKPYDEEVIKREPKVRSVLKNKFSFDFKIYISVADITLLVNEKGTENYYEKTNQNGIFTFKYHISDNKPSEYE